MTDRETNLRSVLFLVIGILLLLSLIICIFIVGGEQDLVKTEAQVTKIENNSDGSGKDEVTLVYDVDGTSYQYVYKTKDDLKVDDTVIIYYHKKNETSVQAFKTSKLIFICPLIGLVICIIGLIELFRKGPNELEVDYKTSVIGVVGDTKQLKIITDDAPVHQYEKTPEEMAEAQVKTIKKDFESISQVENKVLPDSDKVFDEVKNNTSAADLIDEKQNVVEEVKESREEPVMQPAIAPVISEDKEEIKVDNSEKNEESKEEVATEVQENPMAEIRTAPIEKEISVPKVQPEVQEDVTISPVVTSSLDEVINKEETNSISQEEVSALTKKLMERVAQPEEVEEEKVDSTPVQEVSQTPTASQKEIVNKIQNAAKENPSIGEDEIKNMIKDVLKEVISEVKEEEKTEEEVKTPVVQKRVLPNYFYISGNSLIYEELGKKSQELDLNSVNNVVRTINSEGNVVKIIVSSEDRKCILTNMKNIDLEQVANLLHNKMRTIDESFEETIEYKEY